MTTTHAQPTNPVTGPQRAFALARWFTEHRDVSGPQDKFVREDILIDLDNFTAWAPCHNGVALRTDMGSAFIDPHEDHDGIMVIDYTRHDRWGSRVQFWMNASSLRPLGVKLRAHKNLRTTADCIFTSV